MISHSFENDPAKLQFYYCCVGYDFSSCTPLRFSLSLSKCVWAQARNLTRRIKFFFTLHFVWNWGDSREIGTRRLHSAQSSASSKASQQHHAIEHRNKTTVREVSKSGRQWVAIPLIRAKCEFIQCAVDRGIVERARLNDLSSAHTNGKWWQ